MSDHDKLEIANVAMGMLGAKRIASLTEGTVSARIIGAMWDTALGSVLEGYSYTFAIEPLSISSDSVGPTHGKAYSYTLPARCCRVLPPYPELDYLKRDWIVQGRQIYTNEGPTLYVRIASIEANTNTFSRKFRLALAAKLAELCCFQITGSNTMAAKMGQDFTKYELEARALDQTQSPPVRQDLDDDWTNCVRDSGDSGLPQTRS